jgi:protein required for attachment to host cells
VEGVRPRRRPLRRIVVVGDSRRAVLFEDRGTRLRPRLGQILTLEAPENPPTRALGTDEPGRTFQSVGTMRSAMEQTDWHERAKLAFAREVVAALERLCPSSLPPGLLLVAPPRILSYWRSNLPKRFKSVPPVMVDKDLSKEEIPRLEEQLAGL